jgi:hypothetical protein
VRSTLTKTTIVSVPTRESAPAETFDCRVTCIEKVEFDAAGAEESAKRVWIQSSISCLGFVKQRCDAVKDVLEGNGP